jgi:hypothetical protein
MVSKENRGQNTFIFAYFCSRFILGLTAIVNGTLFAYNKTMFFVWLKFTANIVVLASVSHEARNRIFAKNRISNQAKIFI